MTTSVLFSFEERSTSWSRSWRSAGAGGSSFAVLGFRPGIGGLMTANGGRGNGGKGRGKEKRERDLFVFVPHLFRGLWCLWRMIGLFFRILNGPIFGGSLCRPV